MIIIIVHVFSNTCNELHFIIRFEFLFSTCTCISGRLTHQSHLLHNVPEQSL